MVFARTATPDFRRHGAGHVLAMALVFLMARHSGAAETSGLVLEQMSMHADRPVREPMVVEHPSGDLFVAGYRRSTDTDMPPQLWRSRDNAQSWELLDIGSVEDGARGNSDVDLAVGPDGMLYFVVMGYDRAKLRGVHIVIGASPDRGASWTWHTLAQQINSDRPWVEVAPDGVAHVTWNDGEGIRYAISRDGGESWHEQPRIHDKGGSGYLAIGPAGELAVRVVPISAAARVTHPGEDLIMVSVDGGQSWSRRNLPEPLVWSESLGEDGRPARWVEPLAWDARGHLFYLWSTGTTVKLARSTDRGANWTAWTVHEEAATAYFPYLLARANAELAASWFVGRGEALAVRVAHTRIRDGARPELEVALAELFQQPAWLQQNGREERDTAGEYLPLIWRGDQRLAIVTVAQRGNGDTIDMQPVPGRLRQGFGWRVYSLPSD